MLDNMSSETVLNVAPRPPNFSDEEAAQAIILSILRSGKQDRVFHLIQGY